MRHGSCELADCLSIWSKPESSQGRKRHECQEGDDRHSRKKSKIPSSQQSIVRFIRPHADFTDRFSRWLVRIFHELILLCARLVLESKNAPGAFSRFSQFHDKYRPRRLQKHRHQSRRFSSRVFTSARGETLASPDSRRRKRSSITSFTICFRADNVT